MRTKYDQQKECNIQVFVYVVGPEYYGPLYQFVCGESGWFLVVCFLCRINSQSTTFFFLLWEKVAQMPLVKPVCSWVGLAVLGWGVRRFRDDIYMLSKPTEFGKCANTVFYPHASRPKTCLQEDGSFGGAVVKSRCSQELHCNWSIHSYQCKNQ